MYSVPNAPMRKLSIVALERKEADFKFHPNQIYKSSPSWNVSVFINVLSRTSDRTVIIKAVEGDALDQETLARLELSSSMEASLFTDKNNVEYTYVLARRVTVL
tara:strand:- start:185 stop:496 length:312 start_codon:yes stop_codon:yes gene_type:complete